MAAPVPAIHALFPSEHVDARDTSASTRVFDALLPAHDGLPYHLFMIPGTSDLARSISPARSAARLDPRSLSPDRSCSFKFRRTFAASLFPAQNDLAKSTV